jgi:hypothetical protein
VNSVHCKQVAFVLVDILRRPDRQRERYKRHETVQASPATWRKPAGHPDRGIVCWPGSRGGYSSLCGATVEREKSCS